MIIYNLEKFAIEEIFRPYCATFDKRIWQAEYDNNLTPIERVKYRQLQSHYESKIEGENGLEWIIEKVDSNKEWKKLIFERLSEIKFGFYKRLNHPFIDWVKSSLKELISNE